MRSQMSLHSLSLVADVVAGGALNDGVGYFTQVVVHSRVISQQMTLESVFGSVSSLAFVTSEPLPGPMSRKMPSQGFVATVFSETLVTFERLFDFFPVGGFLRSIIVRWTFYKNDFFRHVFHM